MFSTPHLRKLLSCSTVEEKKNGKEKINIVHCKIIPKTHNLYENLL
jgi:hypothetical protein